MKPIKVVVLVEYACNVAESIAVTVGLPVVAVIVSVGVVLIGTTYSQVICLTVVVPFTAESITSDAPE